MKKVFSIFYFFFSISICIAEVISISGDLVEVDPPPSVAQNVFQSNSEIRFFIESENRELLSDLYVNISQGGFYADESNLTPSLIPQGTIVNSYFFHFDPFTSSSTRRVGSITFAEDILGIVVLTNELVNSDSLLGHASTFYDHGSVGQLELISSDIAGDVIFVDDTAGQSTVTMDLISGSAWDHMRIITTITKPTLSLLVPNGGERYLTGKTIDIMYSSTGEISTVDIEYSTDNGVSWISIASGVLNTGTYEWIAPDIDSGSCLVRISSADNTTITDISNNSFTIYPCSENNPADINGDCYIDLQDLAILSQNWLWCGDRYNFDCTTN